MNRYRACVDAYLKQNLVSAAMPGKTNLPDPLNYRACVDAYLKQNLVSAAMPGKTNLPDPLKEYTKLWRKVLKSQGLTTSDMINVGEFSDKNRKMLAEWEPDLRYYDLILVNTSGGKDSAAMVAKINEMTNDPEIRGRVLAVHSDLGGAEHPQVAKVVEQHARLTDMPVTIIEPTIRGQLTGLLIEVEKNAQRIERKWIEKGRKGKKAHAAPGFGTRFCTSALKTGQIKKWLNDWMYQHVLPKGKNIQKTYGRRFRVLNLLGLRAAESALRSKAGFKDKGKKWTNDTRRVTHEWLPIQFYSDADVWDSIRTACLPYHSAYEVGFGRLSCKICPLAGARDLQLGMLVYPDIADKMIALEKRYDFKWKETKSARQLLAEAKKDRSLVAKASKARAQVHRPGGPRMFTLQTTQGPGKGVEYTPSGTRKARVTHYKALK